MSDRKPAPSGASRAQISDDMYRAMEPVAQKHGFASVADLWEHMELLFNSGDFHIERKPGT